MFFIFKYGDFCVVIKKIFLLTACLLFAYQATAAEYSSVISIDVTDKNATFAKEKAWSHANRVALNNVMQKISENVSLDYLSDEEILNLIQQTQVLSEKNSTTRYIGKLKIVFNQEVLDNFLKEKNIQKVDVYTSRVVVVPIYQDGYSAPLSLWERDNKLKNAFASANSKGVVKVEVIEANASNYMTADPQKLVAEDVVLLNTLARENMVQDIFVIYSKNYGAQGLSSDIIHYKDGATTTTNYITNGDTQSNEVFNTFAKQAIEHINSALKEDSMSISSQKQEINVIFDFNSLQEWVHAKKMLNQVSYIKKVTPIAMQTKRVEFSIDFLGDYNQLLYALRPKGLTIKEEFGYYILERI